MFEYYKAAWDCNKNGPEEGEPDLFGLPAEEVLPSCYYNINAQSATINTNCKNTRCEQTELTFDMSDF